MSSHNITPETERVARECVLGLHVLSLRHEGWCKPENILLAARPQGDLR